MADIIQFAVFAIKMYSTYSIIYMCIVEIFKVQYVLVSAWVSKKLLYMHYLFNG